MMQARACSTPNTQSFLRLIWSLLSSNEPNNANQLRPATCASIRSIRGPNQANTRPLRGPIADSQTAEEPSQDTGILNAITSQQQLIVCSFAFNTILEFQQSCKPIKPEIDLMTILVSVYHLVDLAWPNPKSEHMLTTLKLVLPTHTRFVVICFHQTNYNNT